MKTPSSELHDLVHSLTSAEKRYVRRMAMDQETSFLKLMDAILAQKSYNETALKEKFKKEKFIKNLAVNKKYLSDYLLNSLVQFRRKEEEASITQGISMIKVLEEKELFDQATKMVKRLKIKANELGLHAYTLQLLELEKWNLKSGNKTSKEKILKESKVALSQIENINEYWNIHSLATELGLKYEKTQKTEDKNSLEKWLEHSFLLDFKEATTTESQLYYYETKAKIYNVLDRKDDALICYWNYLGIVDKNPKYLNRFSEKYLSILHSISKSYSSRKNDTFVEVIEKIKTVAQFPNFKKTPYIEARIFKEVSILEMTNWLETHQTQKALEQIDNIKEGLNKHRDKISLKEQFDIRYLVAYFLFSNQQFQEALVWLKPLVQYNKTDILSETLATSRLLNLISHFELGEDKKAFSLIKTSRRYIKQSRNLLSSEKHLLEFLSLVLDPSKKTNIQVKNMLLLEQLIQLKTTMKSNVFPKNLDLIFWCESRMLRKAA